MIKKYSKLLLGLTIILGSVFGFYPRNVFAGNYFGGMRTSALSCTCSGNMLIYINTYGNGGGVLALTYDGSGRLFSNNNIYGTYLLGSYTPGGNCLMTGDPCTTVTSDGRFDSMPGTGTS